MATIALNYYCDLNQAVKVQYIDGNVFSGDNAGNTISVYVMDGDQPATIGGSVSADVIRADGSTVAVSGALDGNRAYVILPQACYSVPGSISIVIKNTQNTTITTIAALVGNVYRSSTDEIVDPGTIIPSISSLIAAIDAAIGSIPADYSALLASIAADYSSSKTYPVGAYCWEAGVLKRCIVPITSAETYTAAHWTNAVIGDDLSALKSAITDITGNTPIPITAQNAYIKWENYKMDYENPTPSTNFDYYLVPCTAGDVFTVNATGGNAPRAWCFIDSSKNAIAPYADLAETVTELVVTAPTGAAYLIINDKKTGARSYYGELVKIDVKNLKGEVSDMEKEYGSSGNADFAVTDEQGNVVFQIGRNQPKFVSNLTGKKVSVLGDSISTYDAEGYKMPALDSDHTQFYPRYDVTDTEQMWYKIVCNTIGATFLKSASWGGSMTTGTSQIEDGRPGWTDARIAALADDDVLPDIVLVEMGTNDFDTGKNLGSFDGTTELPEVIQAGGTFSDAYALMISKIHKEYPMARVVCLTIPARKMTNDPEAISDPVYPVVNSIGLCVDDYNEVIRKIARYMNCVVADTYACGINPWNIPLIKSGASYGTVLGDRFVHPNVAGMQMIAETVVDALRGM